MTGRGPERPRSASSIILRVTLLSRWCVDGVRDGPAARRSPSAAPTSRYSPGIAVVAGVGPGSQRRRAAQCQRVIPARPGHRRPLRRWGRPGLPDAATGDQRCRHRDGALHPRCGHPAGPSDPGAVGDGRQPGATAMTGRSRVGAAGRSQPCTSGWRTASSRQPAGVPRTPMRSAGPAVGCRWRRSDLSGRSCAVRAFPLERLHPWHAPPQVSPTNRSEGCDPHWNRTSVRR